MQKKVDFDREASGLPQLINTGSCSLHIIHGAFKSGVEATPWKIKKVLKHLHCLFDHTSARRDDYVTETGSTTFPLSFCATRWLESKQVADRAILIWPNVVKMVQYWKKLPGYKQPPGQDFITISNAIKDDVLIVVKLNFFSFVASILVPYLTRYQENNPSIPFMYDDIQKLVYKLMNIVFTTSFMEAHSNGKKLLELNNEHFQIKSFHKKDVELGCAASTLIQDLLNQGKVSNILFKSFHNECKLFIFAIIKKIKTRMTVGLNFLRRAAVLNPACLIGMGKDRCVRNFTRLVQQLVSMKILKAKEGDDSINQYIDLLSSSNTQILFENFLEKSHSLDTFYFDTLDIPSKYKDLTRVLEAVFVLHNGQASVERGFSLNKEVISTNMGEMTIRSRRMIKDHLYANSLEPSTVELSSELLKFVKSSRAQYLAYLEQQRFVKDVPNKGDALSKLGEQKSKLTKQLKCLNEDYDKYTADANKQSDLEAMKELLARGIAAKDNANKLENKIKTIDLEIAYLKKQY